MDTKLRKRLAERLRDVSGGALIGSSLVGGKGTKLGAARAALTKFKTKDYKKYDAGEVAISKLKKLKELEDRVRDLESVVAASEMPIPKHPKIKVRRSEPVGSSLVGGRCRDVKPKRKSTKKRPESLWITCVKEFQREKGITYKEALQTARPYYEACREEYIKKGYIV